MKKPPEPQPSWVQTLVGHIDAERAERPETPHLAAHQAGVLLADVRAACLAVIEEMRRDAPATRLLLTDETRLFGVSSPVHRACPYVALSPWDEGAGLGGVTIRSVDGQRMREQRQLHFELTEAGPALCWRGAIVTPEAFARDLFGAWLESVLRSLND
jgi:hypothetical protein